MIGHRDHRDHGGLLFSSAPSVCSVAISYHGDTNSQFGPRKKVPMIMSPMLTMTKTRNSVLANSRCVENHLPTPFGLRSMYGTSNSTRTSSVGMPTPPQKAE